MASSRECPLFFNVLSGVVLRMPTIQHPFDDDALPDDDSSAASDGLPIKWYTFYSERERREYYYNPKTKEATWVLPDDAHAHPANSTDQQKIDQRKKEMRIEHSAKDGKDKSSTTPQKVDDTSSDDGNTPQKHPSSPDSIPHDVISDKELQRSIDVTTTKSKRKNWISLCIIAFLCVASLWLTLSFIRLRKSSNADTKTASEEVMKAQQDPTMEKLKVSESSNEVQDLESMDARVSEDEPDIYVDTKASEVISDDQIDSTDDLSEDVADLQVEDLTNTASDDISDTPEDSAHAKTAASEDIIDVEKDSMHTETIASKEINELDEVSGDVDIVASKDITNREQHATSDNAGTPEDLSETREDSAHSEAMVSEDVIEEDSVDVDVTLPVDDEITDDEEQDSTNAKTEASDDEPTDQQHDTEPLKNIVSEIISDSKDDSAAHGDTIDSDDTTDKRQDAANANDNTVEDVTDLPNTAEAIKDIAHSSDEQEDSSGTEKVSSENSVENVEVTVSEDATDVKVSPSDTDNAGTEDITDVNIEATDTNKNTSEESIDNSGQDSAPVISKDDISDSRGPSKVSHTFKDVNITKGDFLLQKQQLDDMLSRIETSMHDVMGDGLSAEVIRQVKVDALVTGDDLSAAVSRGEEILLRVKQAKSSAEQMSPP